jgi:hypothetical protein
VRGGRTLSELQQTVVAWLALVVSCVALICTAIQGRDANSIARQALEYAERANLIAVGSVREYAQLEALCPDSSSARLVNVLDLEAWGFMAGVENTGSVPIEGLSIRLSPLPFYVFNPGYPVDLEGPGFAAMETEVDFEEQLVPSGVATVDLTVPFVDYLQQGSLEGTWTAGVRVLFVPRRLGDELPVRGSRAAESDTCYYVIKFSTEFLGSEETEAYLEEHPGVEVFILPPSVPEA